MEKDILKEIVDKRHKDISQSGVTFGYEIPSERKRKLHPFIDKPGAILEIKRASPSKKDIAPNLNAAETAITYSKAGARAISCLTETNYFKGSLADLMAVADALDEFEQEACKQGLNIEIPALLRKDFLLSAEEVEVSYRAGADAVLLIARILSKETLLEMAQCAERLKMSVLIEVRKNDDLEKLDFILSRVNHNFIVCGVNSRDLQDFSIDMLSPVGMLDSIRGLSSNMRVVFESGILSPQAATFAGKMGFTAILLGEAAAKNPFKAKEFARAFENSVCEISDKVTGTADKEKSLKHKKFWMDYALNLMQSKEDNTLPLVKICGLTRKQDALLAAELGADFLGFIFWKGSKRNVDSKKVCEISNAVRNAGYKGKLVGVIVEPNGDEAKAAFELVRKGILDVIQFHSCTLHAINDVDLPYYYAINISSQNDLQTLDELLVHGEPRVLIDACSNGKIGGTGKTISDELVEKAAKKNRLWLAGGITTENVEYIIEHFNPELIDIASGVEKEPGIKDYAKLKALFSVVKKANKKNV